MEKLATSSKKDKTTYFKTKPQRNMKIQLTTVTSPFSGAAKDQILGWTPTGGRLSGIIHQMKAKNLRIQKLCDAGTKKLYKQRYRTVSMATFLK